MMLKEKPFYLDDEAIAWVEEALTGMTLEEKVGQLFCVLLRGSTQEECDFIRGILSPGGAMYRPMPVESAVQATNMLQQGSRIPLLIAANLEKGGNGIVTEGTLMGSPMEVAATDSADMAAKLGTLCGREGATVGANWAFAPIIDINTNFRNPITNTRTFGSDAERVKVMGVTYVEAIQKLGLAACIKHFPGDGQDERDQHLVTSINSMSCGEWDATYGKVYGACIEQGALTCMVGHIMQPAYSKRLNPALGDGDILPASLSSEIINGLLRGKLGFNGLVVTDATTMAGFTTAMSRRLAVPASIAAGCDMFLFCRNTKEDYGYMLEGVRNGIITPQRLDEAVTRILATKAALGLHRPKPSLSVEAARNVVGCEEHYRWARECADQGITLVKEEPGVLPITPERYKRILCYPIEAAGGFSQYKVVSGACQKVFDAFKAQGMEITIFEPSPESEGKVPPMSDVIGRYDLILYVANLATRSNQTVVRIEWEQPMGANCMHFLHDVPTVFISLENPYHLLDVPRVRTYINTYSSNDIAIEALVEKLMGKSPFRGINPVDPFCGKWDTHL